MSAPSTRKSRERAKTTRPLHQTTKATPTGAGDRIASTLRVKPGKANIWIDADIELDVFPDMSAGIAALRPEPDVDLDLAVEVFRAEQISKHRLLLTDLCKIQNLAPPIYTWERWQARCIMADTERCMAGELNWNDVLWNEVLPQTPAIIDNGLIGDLMRASFPEEAARRIAMKLAQASDKCVDAIVAFTGDRRSNPQSEQKVIAVAHKHTMDFSISGIKNKILKLNNAHYARLKSQYTRITSRTGPAAGKFDETVFHKRVYIVLSRYRSLLGHGFQAALNEHSFRVLLNHFGVKFECFASPLNSTCNSFSSAFPRSDAFFGSIGNFFSLRPTSGSFEANPPFIPEVMMTMCTHITTLLTTASGPMSFVVIIPGWEDDPAWIALSESKFKKQQWLIAACDHGYCDGAQHQRQDRYRESTYDTGVFVLQNDLGAKKWPSNNPLVESSLREAMAHAIPTEMMKLRRLRDGRGSADLDGGGGVYKGKKKNKRQRNEDAGDDLGVKRLKKADVDLKKNKKKKNNNPMS